MTADQSHPDLDDHRPNTLIGSPVRRTEDLRFVQGRGEYIADLRREGQLAAAFVRSTIAHGYLREINHRAAGAMPGVKAIFSAKDFLGDVPRIPFRRPNPSIAPYGQPAIACDKVRYVGEPVAIVLAETEMQAEDAAEAVGVVVDELPPMLSALEAETSATQLFDTSTNVACVFTASKGEVGTAFSGAHLVVAEAVGTQRQIVMPMETRGLLAEWNQSLDHLQMFGAAKLPFFNRRAMASMMGLVETQVDYIELDVGGGFGARGEFYPEDFLVAFAARQLRRPVKWIEGRREHFLATGHARESHAEVEFAFRRDGTILGARGILRGNIGAYMRPNGTTPIRNMAQFLSGPYRIPNIHLEARGIVTNKTPAGTYRGPGRYEGCLACETILDTAASKLEMDRLAIRRRNLLGHVEMPYQLATIAPADSADIAACDSGDYRQAFERCLIEARWTEKMPLQGQLIEGRWHGLGVGSFIEGGASGPQENARIAIEDGRVVVYAGSSAVGQGLETVLAQIAADALEVPLADVTVRHGSTIYLADGWGSYGSRATVMGGCAVQAAATGLLERFREAAAMRLGAEPAALRIANGRAESADGAILALCAMTGLACDGQFRNSKPTYTFGTAVAHVAVDPETGMVEVLDYLVVDDVGRIINPLTLHGQVQGAAIQGMGSVFREELVYDEAGQLCVGSLMDYSVPLADDYPHVRCISEENYPSPNNPLGAKGAGEGGIIPVGAVILNAVAAALAPLGVRPRQLPLTSFRVWTLIRDETEKRKRTV